LLIHPRARAFTPRTVESAAGQVRARHRLANAQCFAPAI
jgi:hypothetical protein